ncbi:MAG: flagellar motor switch protein FliM [Oscillospiraceae bacterium]|nr:flagellar motor switch protein FliM [Oscillospiraceae bacterium]
MSEILSQAEIDELLGSLMTGEAAAVSPEASGGSSAMKVKEYDFRTANRFPKEQMRTFHVVFETYSQLLSNRLSSVLRVSCECEILSIEECSYSEFNNSLPVPVVLAIMEAPPMNGSLISQMSPEFSYMIISRLFGGGTAGENSKQFTEIELALIERVLNQAIDVFDEAWDKVIGLSTKLERIETSPQFAQITAPNEPVAVIIMNITMGEESGLMSICVPHTAIEPVAQQLNTRMWFSGASRDDGKNGEQADVLRDQLLKTPVPLTAFFEQTPATVSDLVNLQIGDVIKLDHSIDHPLTIKVHHMPKFRAAVGTAGLKYALRIVDIIEEEKQNEFVTR